jgi:hypothetical protein
MPAGAEFLFFFRPVINNAGQTAFAALDTDNFALWSETSGVLVSVARSGTQAPDTPAGVNFNVIDDDVLLNAAGGTAFDSTLSGSGVNSSNDRGFWSSASSSGSLGLVARRGSHAPGTASDVNFDELDMPSLNALGQTVFRATLTGTGVNGSNNDGIWMGAPGSVALVARAGSQAAALAPGVNYFHFGPPPALNPAGGIAFEATLSGTGVNSSNDAAVWQGNPGSLRLVTREGNQAPGTPAGVNFKQMNTPVLNGAGQTAFSAFLTGSGVDLSNDYGIWSEGGGSLALVARSGSPAAGTASGVVFSGFFPPVLNAAGKVAFKGVLAGTGVSSANDHGLWSEASGSLQLVAREGNPAPGTTSGVNFGTFDMITVNASGQIAFRASLAGTGVTTSNDEGIWATDSTGTLRLIVRKGAAFEVAPSDVRTILNVVYAGGDPTLGGACNLSSCTGNEDGRASPFNDSGFITFGLDFNDFSGGIFVSDLVANTVPGDYNRNGIVDAADYVVWRNTEPENQTGYNTWRTNFGRTSAAGSSMSPALAVPEPNSLSICGLLITLHFLREKKWTRDRTGGQKLKVVFFCTHAIVTP